MSQDATIMTAAPSRQLSYALPVKDGMLPYQIPNANAVNHV